MALDIYPQGFQRQNGVSVLWKEAFVLDHPRTVHLHTKLFKHAALKGKDSLTGHVWYTPLLTVLLQLGRTTGHSLIREKI